MTRRTVVFPRSCGCVGRPGWPKPRSSMRFVQRERRGGSSGRPSPAMGRNSPPHSLKTRRIRSGGRRTSPSRSCCKAMGAPGGALEVAAGPGLRVFRPPMPAVLDASDSRGAC